MPTLATPTATHALVCTFSVIMSDGSPFAGTMAILPVNSAQTGILQIVGNQVQTSRSLSVGGGDFAGNYIIAPTQNGVQCTAYPWLNLLLT